LIRRNRQGLTHYFSKDQQNQVKGVIGGGLKDHGKVKFKNPSHQKEKQSGIVLWAGNTPLTWKSILSTLRVSPPPLHTLCHKVFLTKGQGVLADK